MAPSSARPSSVSSAKVPRALTAVYTKFWLIWCARPSAMEFIELATQSGHLELQIEEVAVGAASALVGRSIKASPIRSELGIIIVAVKRPDGKMAFNPSPDTTLEAGDLLITLGHRQQLDRLEAMAAGR